MGDPAGPGVFCISVTQKASELAMEGRSRRGGSFCKATPCSTQGWHALFLQDTAVVARDQAAGGPTPDSRVTLTSRIQLPLVPSCMLTWKH